MALGAAALSLLVTAALAVWSGQALDAIEARVGDAVWRSGATRTEERRLIVVDIDDRSLEQTGSWPWPRPTVAELLDRIGSLGAQLQILDVVFSDARPDDAALLNAVKRNRPVLAQVFALPTAQGSESMPQAGQPASPLDWPSCPAPFAQAGGFLANLPALAQLGQPPAGHTGHITPSLAHDGVVRHQPAVVCWQNKAYPALSLAAVMQATGETELRPQRGSLWEAPWSLVGTKQVLPRLPLDEQGNIRIAWRQHPSSFISVSASDVLRGNVPPELFKGAWVLIGSSAFGLNDSIATPYGPTAAGLVAHAQIMTAWLDGRTPYTPRGAWLVQLGSVMAGLGGLFALVWRTAAAEHTSNAPSSADAPPPRRAALLLPAAGLLMAMALCLGHAVLVWQAGIWIGWATPALALLLAALAMGSAEHLRTRLERQRLFQHLSSYLPAPVAASLALQAPSGTIRAQTRHVTVLFADIRNFSAYCEARPPEESAAVLHAFFSAATQVVQRHAGVIEAFQGDAIMAVWNGAEDETLNQQQPEHASLAMAAALELLSTSRGLLPDPAPGGLEPLQLGLGLETGLATAGSFGLASRRTHLVMGRTVTIANRLVAMTADLAHPILVGEGLATQVGGQAAGVQLESLGTFLLDGLRMPHHVYAVPMDVLTPPPPPHTTTASTS
jgi:adenylate cyclase